ncbi:MAG TPA: MFS transporter [Gemmatimonadaceae bacterium]|nr:MFS transporter [Gemmatimonadaceae bacterium]
MSSRRVLFACACLGLLTFGIVLTTLGSMLPSIMERFGIDKAQAGSLFLLMTLGILAASLIFGPLVDRYGYKGILLAAVALIALGLEGIAFATSLGWLRAAVIVIGFGGGIINGGTNALVADISTDGRAANLNLLGVFFGVGAMGVPFALGVLVNRYSQTALIAGVGALVLVPFAVIAAAGFPAPKQPQGFPISDARRLVRDRLLLLMGLMLFLESGIEITVGGWTSTFVTEVLAVPARNALIILSLYWMGMMLARVALGYILRRTSPFSVLYICLVIALAGAGVLLTTQSAGLAASGVFMLGVGFAAMFPTVLGFVGDRYSTLSGTAFSVAIAMALCGGMLLPYAAGLIGMRYGMRGSFAIVPAALIVLGGLLGILMRNLRAPSPTS